MNNIKNVKFTSVKIDEFSLNEDLEQLCNLCGCAQVEILPEVEFLDKKQVKSFCLSIFCASKECRNLSYNYFDINDKMTACINIEDFTPLPKGLKLSCKKCGDQNLKVKIRLDQSGFKYVYDIVIVTLTCSCGNEIEYTFLGKYY